MGKKHREQREKLQNQGLSPDAINAVMESNKHEEEVKNLKIIKNIIITKYNNKHSRDEVKVRGKVLITAIPTDVGFYNVTCQIAYAKRNDDSIDSKKLTQATLFKRLERRPLTVFKIANAKKEDLPLIVDEGIMIAKNLGQDVATKRLCDMEKTIRDHFNLV